MSHLKFLCAFLSVLLLGFTFLNAGEPVKAKWNMRDHIDCTDVSVFVHRGAGDLAPENALPSLITHPTSLKHLPNSTASYMNT